MIKTIFLTLLLAISTSAQAIVSAPIIDVTPGKTFTVAIDLEDAEEVMATDININYDRRVLTPVGDNFGCEGVVMIVTCNAFDGVLRISAYTPYLTNGGTLLTVRFTASKQGCSELVFDLLHVYGVGGLVRSAGVDGMVCVTP